MKLTISFLVFVLLFVPLQPAAASADRSVILTADQVVGANDIEGAIISATEEGTRPGTVILDGRKGVFVLSSEDRSLNIFVSNLTLRGVNGAVIQDCDDGLFFDNFPLHDVRVEGITFLCNGDGVEAAGAFRDVTLRNNLFQAQNHGIGLTGASSGWLITGNLIQARGDAIRMSGGDRMAVTGNHLSGGGIGVALLGTAQSQVRLNAIHAEYQGVLIGQEAWKNSVQANTILGVSASGIALEPDVTGNRVTANVVLCAAGSSCLTVDAMPEVAEVNAIFGNRPR